MVKKTENQRGFSTIEFKDYYDVDCTIQKSSLASNDAIWFGVNDGRPMRQDENKRWVEYTLPDDVLLYTRMHLTQAQVRELLPILKHFADSGELPNTIPPKKKKEGEK